jgi:hypothetical protein
MLFGTLVAETILASVHVRAHPTGRTYGRNDLIKTLHKPLARRGPFSNRASFVNSLFLPFVAVSGSRFSPRSEGSAATSGPKHRRCNVHNGLAWYCMRPKAHLRSRLRPRPVGQPSHPRRRSGWISVWDSSGGRRLLGPTEWLARTPDAVHDHRKFPGKRDTRLTST